MQLLQHFKELTIRPKNAEKLKSLILELAVKGKLTHNWRKKSNSNIGSDELIRIIREGKKLVLLESEVKKEKKIDSIDSTDIKFKLPKNWAWVRFASAAYICRGGSPRPIKDFITEDSDGINWIKIGDTKGVLKYIENCREKIIPEGLKKSRLVKPGDFILSNSMSFGKPYIMKTTGCIHDGWLLIREVKEAIDKNYLYHMLSSPYVYSSFKDSASGGVVQNLNIEKVRQTLIPVPPIEEQKEIVKVVETLFKEVEQLEQLTVKRIALKEDFVMSALNQLTTNNIKQESAFLQEHFKSFFNETTNIKKLRETVLQLAIQGKLTADWRGHNPDTEDASVLLKRIQKEKAQLIAAKKIKKEKALPVIDKEDIPFELPKGWVWCRLQDVIKISSGKGLTSANMDKSGNIPVYGGNGITGYHSRGNVEKPTIVIGRVGYYCGSIHLTEANAWVTDNAFVTYYSEENIYRDFLLWLLRGTNLKEDENATAQPVISGRKIYPIIIALPPHEEQKVIVEKVNNLMSLCDALEQEVQKSQENSGNLMQSVLREVFEN